MLSVLIYAVQHCAVDSTMLEPATVYTVIKRIEFHLPELVHRVFWMGCITQQRTLFVRQQH